MAELHRSRDSQSLSVSDLLVRERGGKTSARERIAQTLAFAADHLQTRDYLVGNGFTVADAYLAWSLLLVGRGGAEVAQWPALAAYLERIQARPRVAEAIATEMALRQAIRR